MHPQRYELTSAVTLSMMKKRRSKQELIQDYSLYILISLVIAAIALTAAKMGITDRIFKTWGSFLFATPFIFGLLISESRHLRRRWQFWAAMAVLLVVHCVFFAITFAYADEWRAAWTVYLIGGEAILFQLFSPMLWLWLKIDP